jgi:hypothetical protein
VPFKSNLLPLAREYQMQSEMSEQEVMQSLSDQGGITDIAKVTRFTGRRNDRIVYVELLQYGGDVDGLFQVRASYGNGKWIEGHANQSLSWAVDTLDWGKLDE